MVLNYDSEKSKTAANAYRRKTLCTYSQLTKKPHKFGSDFYSSCSNKTRNPIKVIISLPCIIF